MEKKVIKMLSLIVMVCTMVAFAGCGDECECGCGKKEKDCKCNGNCKEEPAPASLRKMGYLGNEDLTHIPRDMNTELIGRQYGISEDLPQKADLTHYMPPIGDQGNYGTCVAWATGYYYRTYLRAKAFNLTKNSGLSNSENQFSPKDLFWAIDKIYKGSDCDGTNFEPAFNVLQNRGVATMNVVPYQNLGDCSQTPDELWTRDANKYKIARWRLIDQSKFNQTCIKSYLNQGIPVAFCAKVGYEFQLFKGTRFTSQNLSSGYGLHAMVICGYDDDKEAFRVINSWGDSWGDDGYVWVDYNLFFENFAINGFVAYSDDNNNNPYDDDSPSNYDLEPTFIDFLDCSGKSDPTWRTIRYDVKNVGTQTIPSSKNWTIALLYYNAYNLKDYNFVLIDYYTNKFGNQGDVCPKWTEDSEWGKPLSIIQVGAEGYSWNNVDIAGGQSVAGAVFNTESFRWDVKMPDDLNGDYFVAICADAFNNLKEIDESNNMLLATNRPIHFVNGVPTNLQNKKGGVGKSYNDVLLADPNAYTPEEVLAFIQVQKKSGIFEREANKVLQIK